MKNYIMNILKKIKSYLHFQKSIVESVNGFNSVQSSRVINELRYRLKYDELTTKALSETENGIIKEQNGCLTVA